MLVESRSVIGTILTPKTCLKVLLQDGLEMAADAALFIQASNSLEKVGAPTHCHA